MQFLFQWFMNLFQQIPDWTLRHRFKVWIGFILIVLAILPGVTRFQLNLSEEFFFQDNDPVKKAFERFRLQFGGDEAIYLVYEAKDGDIFSTRSLSALRSLQEEILNYRLQLEPGTSSALDHIVDVTSLINISYLNASEDSLTSSQFIGDRIPTTPAEIEAYRQKALAHPDYPLLYVSNDSRYGSILIRTDFKTELIDLNEETPVPAQSQDADLGTGLDDLTLEYEEYDDFAELDVSSFDTSALEDTAASENYRFETVDVQEYSDVMAALKTYLDKPEYTQHLTILATGNPPLNAFIWDNFVPQINFFMMITLLIVMGALFILFRSFSAVLWPTLIIILCSALTIAVMGWLGLVMNLMFNVTIILILVVGVADAVHLISGYVFFRQQGFEHREALREAYAKAGMAIFLTSVTTAIGMLALVTVPLTPIQNFGISCAIGVLFAFIVSVVMLPLLLEIWKPAKKLPSHPSSHHEPSTTTKAAKPLSWVQQFLNAIEPYALAAPWFNISIFSILAVVFIFGATKIRVDSNQINVFGEGHEIRQAYDIVDQNMGGTQNLEIFLESQQEGIFQDPAVLNMMDELQNYIEGVPNVVVTRSLVNIVKDANQSLHAGQAAYYSIPQDARQLQQTLFLFNNANPKDRRRVVSDDYSKAHITINTVTIGSKESVVLFEEVEKKIQELISPLQQQYPSLKATLTGSVTLIVKMVDYLSWSQITGFGLALTAISLILLGIFGSIRVGLIALFPNLFPLIVVFGAMGYLNIPIDIDTLIVAPLMIGIVVDDTIHFLTHYREEIIKSHGDILKAIHEVFKEVGQAITFTSLILALAFISFVGLEHQGLKSFGVLSAIAIVTALIAELFLLPALLYVTRTTFKRQRMKLQSTGSVQTNDLSVK